MASNKEMIERIEEYKRQGANMIMLCNPWTLPEMHRLLLSEVKLSPNTADGDVYNRKGVAGFLLHLRAIEKLSVEAGIEWDPANTKPVTLTRDYVHYMAVGCVPTEYGERQWWKGEGELDLEILREDLVDQYQQKAREKKKDQSWVDYCVRRDFSQKRGQKLQLAASKAKRVVMIKILGLKGTYTQKELNQPFVIVRCIVAPDLSSPETQRLIIQASIQSKLGIYGQPSAPTQAALPDHASQDSVVDVPFNEVSTGAGLDDPAEPAFEEPSEIEVFQSCDPQSRVETLRQLADRKGYDLKSLPTQVDKMSARNQDRFYQHLSVMPDLASKTDDDIPF